MEDDRDQQCLEAIIIKLKEAFLVLLLMSHQYEKAVEVALEAGLYDQAADCANKAKDYTPSSIKETNEMSKHQREKKVLWLKIAEFMFKHEIGSQYSTEKL